MERSLRERKHSATDITRNFHLHGRYISRSHSDRTHGSLQPTRAAPLVQDLESLRETLPQIIATARPYFRASSRPAFAGLDSREYGDRFGKASCR